MTGRMSEVGVTVLRGRAIFGGRTTSIPDRKRAEQQLRRLLLERGLDPEDWSVTEEVLAKAREECIDSLKTMGMSQPSNALRSDI